MNNTVAMSIVVAILLSLGVTASPALTNTAGGALRPHICPRACRVRLRKDFKACMAACRKNGTSAGHCRTACGQVRLEAWLRCKDAANPTPPSCDRTPQRMDGSDPAAQGQSPSGGAHEPEESIVLPSC